MFIKSHINLFSSVKKKVTANLNLGASDLNLGTAFSNFGTSDPNINLCTGDFY